MRKEADKEVSKLESREEKIERLFQMCDSDARCDEQVQGGMMSRCKEA